MPIDRCDDDPFLPEEGLLTSPAFWTAYLVRMWAMDAPAGRRVAEWFGTDAAGADAVWEQYLIDVGRFRIPFDDGHCVWVTSCEFPTEWGTDYSVRHPDRGGPSRSPASPGTWRSVSVSTSTRRGPACRGGS